MQRSFKTFKIFQDYSHPQKDKILKYIELLYSVGSELNKIDSLQDRKLTAAKQAGLKADEMQTIFEEKDEAFAELRHHYMSFYQYHNKYANLMVFQHMLWAAQQEAMKPVEAKAWGDWDKLSDFIIKMEQVVSKLFIEIYTDQKIIDHAKEQIRTAKSVEERLKNKNQK